MHHIRETTLIRSISMAYSTEPSPTRILTNLPPPYTWTGARVGELRYARKGASSTHHQTNLSSQCQHIRLHLHSRPLHRPQTHTLLNPHFAPYGSKPLLPRRAHRPFPRIQQQEHNPRRRQPGSLPTPRVMALHLDHPRAIQRRKTSLLHTAAPVQSRRPPVSRGPEKQRRGSDFRPGGPHKLRPHAERYAHFVRGDPRLGASARLGA